MFGLCVVFLLDFLVSRFLFLFLAFKDVWFLGFLVSENPRMLLKDIWSILQKCQFVFLISIDVISKIFNNLQTCLHHFAGARFLNTGKVEIRNFKIYKNQYVVNVLVFY